MRGINRRNQYEREFLGETIKIDATAYGGTGFLQPRRVRELCLVELVDEPLGAEGLGAAPEGQPEETRTRKRPY